MEHLPSSPSVLLSVPFLAEIKDYQPDDFFKFSTQAEDLTITQLLKQGPKALRSNASVPSFLQGWLYFELLAQFLGITINSHEFYDLDQDNKPKLHTHELKTLLQEWHIRMDQTEPSHEQVRNEIRTYHALSEARTFVSRWCSDTRFMENSFDVDDQDMDVSMLSDTSSKLDPALCLSFSILGETLERAVYVRRRRSNPGAKLIPESVTSTHTWDLPHVETKGWGVSEALTESMLDLKWCARDVRRIQETMPDISSVYFAHSFLPARMLRVDHSNCKFNYCAVEPSSIKDFRHVREDCRCANEKPDTVEIERIIQKGGIPLIKFQNGGRGGLEVVEYDFESNSPKFGAVSHVWSNGLGKIGEGIPRCQMKDLRSRFRKLNDNASDMPIWIDLLCIPPQYDTRKKAIPKMKEIYELAHAVLVLDQDLLQISTRIDPLEATVRINIGLWATRLWTLQEGVISKRLHFAFLDGSIPATKLEDGYNEAKTNIDNNYHYVCKAGRLFSSSMHSLQQREEHNKVGNAWQSLQWRTTTRNTDETICLATILGMDPTPILDIQPVKNSIDECLEKRMVCFLSMLDAKVGIPPGIIFLPGPKLDAKGFSWAPKTWMTQQRRQNNLPLFDRYTRATFLTTRGLHVQYPGVLLHPPTNPVHSRFWIPVSRKLHTWYRVDYVDDEYQGGSDWEDIWKQACKFGEPAIVLNQFERRETPEIALLVAHVDKREETKYVPGQVNWKRESIRWVKTLCRLWVRLETDHHKIDGLIENFRQQVDDMMWADRLEADQRWVVDGIS